MHLDTAGLALCLSSTIWLITHLFIIPYEVHWSIKFYHHRTSYVIEKRQAALFLCDRCFFWIASSLWYTNYSLAAADISDVGFSINYSIQRIAFLLHGLVFQPLFWLSLLFPVVRLWLIYYLIRRNSAIIHNEWQSIIDPTIGDRNWWLSHCRSWGSWKWLRKYVIIIAMILYPVLTVPVFVSPNIGFDAVIIISSLLLIVCPFTFFMLILVTVTPENDTIGIRNELRFVIKGARYPLYRFRSKSARILKHLVKNQMLVR